MPAISKAARPSFERSAKADSGTQNAVGPARYGRDPGGYRNYRRCQTPGVRTGRPDSRGEVRTGLAYAGGSFLFEAAKVL